ncbi:MAG TPA: NADH-quinone oxidoreductase subunit C [Steroidobacteraceae bacterium]|nr:NADH-quinone oxidoreductase subunit C [Steroidobacteraceae bacterium]HRX90341.1 NADH-quinone oxidoreductase subunit C [Steroidobacteraceae bacterium]
MTQRMTNLAEAIEAQLADKLLRVESLPDELCYEVQPEHILAVCQALRDAPALRFEMLIDLCGIDYLDYGLDEWKTASATRSGFSRGVERGRPRAPHDGARFAIAYQLLSITHNVRLRLRARCVDAEDPIIDSVVGIWPSANWFEREAFDLFGILFSGHPDLRRILTDYGFIGHPFRKDFPLIGNVEVRYDPAQGRVIYEPVSIEPRTLVPKVIRHDSRYDPALTAAASAATKS